MLCGGWTETRDADPDIQDIADKVKPEFEKKTNESYQQFTAIKYRCQVVSGTNYLIKICVGDMSYVHILVYQPLPVYKEPLVLSDYQTGKTKDDELIPF